MKEKKKRGREKEKNKREKERGKRKGEKNGGTVLMVFSCRESALFLCRDRGFHVMIEIVTTRGQVLQQV